MKIIEYSTKHEHSQKYPLVLLTVEQGKTNKNVLQILKCPLDLHQQPLVRMVGRVELSCPIVDTGTGNTICTF